MTTLSKTFDDEIAAAKNDTEKITAIIRRMKG